MVLSPAIPIFQINRSDVQNVSKAWQCSIAADFGPSIMDTGQQMQKTTATCFCGTLALCYRQR